MPVFNHPEFDGHEQVAFFAEPRVGLRAIVAIHNTVRGPALGGCRMVAYPSEEEALRDVLRLSKGMTYKSAISALPLGGGKSVIIGDPGKDKTEPLLQAFGRCLEQLGGRYIVAEDSGTSVADMQIIASQTQYVSGIGERSTVDGGVADGDPSPATAYGVFMGIRAAVKAELERENLRGISVAVQGVGAVGSRLVQHLLDDGARVYVSDVLPERANNIVSRLGVEALPADDIYAAPVEVFSPCGFGAVLNDRTIPRLHARIVAGAANNQLAERRHADMLKQRGILYVPDFAINAGGVIDIAGFQAGLSHQACFQQVGQIYKTITDIIRLAHEHRTTTAAVAIEMAERNFRRE